MSSESQRIEELESRLQQLSAELAEMRSNITEKTAVKRQVRAKATVETAAVESVDTESEGSSRRRFLTKAAIGAAGAGILMARSAEPAFANDPNDLTMGARKSIAAFTQGDYTGTTANTTAFLFQSGVANVATDSGADSAAALGGWASADGTPLTGVYAYSEKSNGNGLYAQANTAVVAKGVASGITATASGAQVGVAGRFTAQKAALALGLSNSRLVGASERGMIAVEGLTTPGAVHGTTWICYESGNPGKWARVASLDSGLFTAITPTRVYDSRAAQPSPGKLFANTNRTISVADGRDVTTGAVTTSNIVPAGAVSIAYNVTLTGTEGTGGFVAINEGGNTTVSASIINWTSANLDIANSSVVLLNSNREITVIGRGNNTHFIIDILGYYL